MGVAQVTKTFVQCLPSADILAWLAPRVPAPSMWPKTQSAKSVNDLIGPAGGPYGLAGNPYLVAHAVSPGMRAMTGADAWIPVTSSSQSDTQRPAISHQGVVRPTRLSSSRPFAAACSALE